MITERENALKCLGLVNQQIAEIDAELQVLVDKLVVGAIIPTLARVQEVNLLRRRAHYEKIANSVSSSIKHF